MLLKGGGPQEENVEKRREARYCVSIFVSDGNARMQTKLKAAFTLHNLLKAHKRSCRNPPY